MMIWGLNFVVVKIGLAQMPPLLFVALRFAVVALILAPFVKPPRGHFLPIFGISFTLGFLHFALMFTALKTIDVATAAITIQLQVPIAALMAAVVFKDTLGWRRTLGMAVAFAGVALISGEPRLDGQYLALAMVIGGTIVWAVANVQIKLLTEVNGTALNAWVAVFATPQLLLGSLVLETGQWHALAQADWNAFLAILYQAVLVVAIGYGTWYRLLRRYDINQVIPFTLLVPIFGVAGGVLFLGEVLTLSLMVGGCLTVAGVAIIVLRRPKVAAPETERL
jgi:O-acetylserine/cysteine efflux transporter